MALKSFVPPCSSFHGEYVFGIIIELYFSCYVSFANSHSRLDLRNFLYSGMHVDGINLNVCNFKSIKIDSI